MNCEHLVAKKSIAYLSVLLCCWGAYCFAADDAPNTQDSTQVDWSNKPLDEVRKAAAMQNLDAEYWLGKRYLEGIGVETNTEAALWWLRRAAEQGNAKAQAALVKYANESPKSPLVTQTPQTATTEQQPVPQESPSRPVIPEPPPPTISFSCPGLGYAWLKDDIKFTDNDKTPFPTLMRGAPCKIIRETNKGYLVLATDVKGCNRPAVIPFSDRMGNPTVVDGFINSAGAEPQPGFFVIPKGKKYEVIAQTETNYYTIRYDFQGLSKTVQVARHTVDFMSAADYQKAGLAVLTELAAQADKISKDGDYSGVGKPFLEYRGEFADETLEARTQLAQQYIAYAAQVYEIRQRNKGLVLCQGQWVTSGEARRREQAANAEAQRRENEAEELRLAQVADGAGLSEHLDALKQKVTGQVQSGTMIIVNNDDANRTVLAYGVKHFDANVVAFHLMAGTPSRKQLILLSSCDGVPVRETQTLKLYLEKAIKWSQTAKENGVGPFHKELGSLRTFCAAANQSSEVNLHFSYDLGTTTGESGVVVLGSSEMFHQDDSNFISIAQAKQMIDLLDYALTINKFLARMGGGLQAALLQSERKTENLFK